MIKKSLISINYYNSRSIWAEAVALARKAEQAFKKQLQIVYLITKHKFADLTFSLELACAPISKCWQFSLLLGFWSAGLIGIYILAQSWHSQYCLLQDQEQLNCNRYSSESLWRDFVRIFARNPGDRYDAWRPLTISGSMIACGYCRWHIDKRLSALIWRAWNHFYNTSTPTIFEACNWTWVSGEVIMISDQQSWSILQYSKFWLASSFQSLRSANLTL